MRVLERVAAATEETAVIEQQAKQEGRTLVMILAPKNTKTKKGGTLKAQPVVVKPVEVPAGEPEVKQIEDGVDDAKNENQ
jgi:hypothetical protein